MLPALWQNDRRSSTSHRGNTGVKRTPNKSQHEKLTGEENAPAAPVGVRTHEVRALYRLICPDPEACIRFVLLPALFMALGSQEP